MSTAARERQALADALLEAGPDAPTLCEGWTAQDLAAHLVAREHRPDAAAGVGGGPLAAWTHAVEARYARRPFADLVETFRSGPPRLGWTGLPGVDRVVNVTEHFVHTEDVRRARPGWEPRDLPAAAQDTLWAQVTAAARAAFRHSPVGVVLVVPGGPRKVVRRGKESVTLTGAPGELLLYTLGRRDHARVELGGTPDARARFSRRS